MIKSEFTFRRFLDTFVPGFIVVIAIWYLYKPYINKFFPTIVLVENPLKVAPLIQSNLTPVKFFHSFILFILVFFVFFLSVMPGSTLNFVYKYNDSFLLLHLRSDSPKSSIRIA